eukprot:m.127651 g.127651  ORF g.127651 m.127651 type:complete len:332 (+) comp22247_c0_seq1:323-1318(+)
MHDKHVAPEPVFVKPKHMIFTVPPTEPDVYRVPKALGAGHPKMGVTLRHSAGSDVVQDAGDGDLKHRVSRHRAEHVHFKHPFHWHVVPRRRELGALRESGVDEGLARPVVDVRIPPPALEQQHVPEEVCAVCAGEQRVIEIPSLVTVLCSNKFFKHRVGPECVPKSGVHRNPRARTRDRRVDPRLVNVLRNGLWVAPPFRGYKYRWRRWRRCRTRLRPCRVGAPQLRVVALVLILCHFELAGAKSDRRHAGSGFCPCTPAGGIPRRHRHGTDDRAEQYHSYSSLHTRCRSRHDPSRASPKICCCSPMHHFNRGKTQPDTRGRRNQRGVSAA